MNASRPCRCEIIARETPRVMTHCHRCKKTTEFYCSDKFRVNAQQKTIDVWLIYKCLHCDSTWNCPILSRVHTNSMDRALHQRFMNNDAETAWEHAFQIGRLRRLCSGVNTDIKYTLQCDPIDLESGNVEIQLFSKYAWELRLDRLLRELLGLSRSVLIQMESSGSLLTQPETGLTSKLKGDLRIILINGR